jgi:hypothetical protein
MPGADIDPEFDGNSGRNRERRLPVPSHETGPKSALDFDAGQGRDE